MTKVSQYYSGIDQLKGVLIILVIIGHIIPLSIDQSLSRYFIYSFHMPLFIAVSGFLINYDKFGSLSFNELVKKYLHRVIIPWLIAVAIYYLFLNFSRLSVSVFFSLLVKPYYHLWFIPAFLSYVLLVWICAKTKLNIWYLLMAGYIIGVTGYIVSPFKGPISELFAHTFRLWFLPFFCLGIFLRQNNSVNKLKNYQLTLFFLVVLLMAGNLYLFFYDQYYVHFVNYWLFNTCLGALALVTAYNGKMVTARFLVWTGKNSLPIYLWHIIPIKLSTAITQGKPILYYVCCIVSVLGLFILVHLLSRFAVVDRYVFGGGLRHGEAQ